MVSGAGSPGAAVQQGDGNVNCPQCADKELTKSDVEGYPIKVDHCAQCGGAWFDAGEMEQLLDVPPAQVEIPRSARLSRRKCPNCARLLRTFYYPDTLTTTDMCAECRGMWLDKGEFQEIDTVRRYLKKAVKSAAIPDKKSGEPSRFKASVISFINGTISALNTWD